MLPGPIFRREWKAGGRRPFRSRTTLGLVISLFIIPPGLFLLFASGRIMQDTGISPPAATRMYAAYAVAATIAIETWILSLLAATTTGVSIAEEREKDTLQLLLLTRLTRLELAATKLAGRLIPVFSAILTGLPLILVGAWFADLPPLLVLEALAVVASTATVAGSLGILASSRHDRSAAANGEAMAWTVLWLIALPIAWFLPKRSGTLWGELLIEMQRLASWLAPSSPLSIVTDRSWLSGAGNAADALANRLLTMLAMQAVLVVIALAGAVGGLRLREPHPTSMDPHRGYRPPVGDDPIYWREYLLPWRGARVPTLVIVARQLWIVIRTLLLLALQAVILAAAVALPLGMIIAAGWYSYYSFREYWGFGALPAGIESARGQFNGFIRLVTFVLGSAPITSVAAAAAGRITIERDKKTWEPLLTTPLTAAQILRSKLRVDVRSAWNVERWLIPLWLLGVVCGALHPLGVPLAAAGVVVSIWLGLALGIRSGLRPDAKILPPNSIPGWTLALMFVGGLTIVAPLCSSQDLDTLRSFAPWLPWLAAGVHIAVVIAMAAWARSLTRLCFEHFDEWVGRPHRANQAEPRRDPAPPADVEPREPAAIGLPPRRSDPSLLISPRR